MTPEIQAAAELIHSQSWCDVVGGYAELERAAKVLADWAVSLAARLAALERDSARLATILTVVRPKREREPDAGWMDWVIPTARCDSFEEAIDHRATKELAEMQHRVGMELKAERAATRTGETVE